MVQRGRRREDEDLWPGWDQNTPTQQQTARWISSFLDGPRCADVSPSLRLTRDPRPGRSGLPRLPSTAPRAPRPPHGSSRDRSITHGTGGNGGRGRWRWEKKQEVEKGQHVNVFLACEGATRDDSNKGRRGEKGEGREGAPFTVWSRGETREGQRKPRGCDRRGSRGRQIRGQAKVASRPQQTSLPED